MVVANKNDGNNDGDNNGDNNASMPLAAILLPPPALPPPPMESADMMPDPDNNPACRWRCLTRASEKTVPVLICRAYMRGTWY